MKKNLVVLAYKNLSVTKEFKPSDWDLFIRQAKKSNLLASFHYRLEQENLLQDTPDRVHTHMYAARIVADKHAKDTEWEINRLENALSRIELPLILLKGGAYIAAKLPSGKGRLFQDIDILVPHKKLYQAEKALNKEGWHCGNVAPYDNKYYRKWMHEIPPMRHLTRRTLLDVHHHIVPLTTSIKPDAEKLLSNAVPISQFSNIMTLSPLDRVLHSAVHLFYDGEFDNALRDLIDIDQLINDGFEKDNNFVNALIERANEIELSRPLYYSLRYLRLIFEKKYSNAQNEIPIKDKPNPVLLYIMDRLFITAIIKHHHTCGRKSTGLIRWCLYVRAHYLRMPLYQLIPHLAHKAIYKETN